MADSQIDISRLERKIDGLSSQTEYVSRQVGAVSERVDMVDNRLESLRQEFEKMIVEQRRTAAVQQAATELVRIRQELDQEFGHYRVVRETMLGVLQATDLALVKETTISRVSEELMLSAPDYWLAPCLVAVAAWIANNRSLAERAIAESMRRDETKTALTMALICRRNGRVSTCYEWLGIYFAKQDATKISESGYTCIDAYINGIFGPDEKHICDDYVSKWMEELKGSDTEFEAHQEQAWKGYLTSFHRNDMYPNMKACVPQYSEIDSYVGRILSVEAIADNFKKISEASVDDRQMKEKVDDLLIELVRQHTDKEQELRDEEAIQIDIKNSGGDVERAKAHIAEEKRRRQAKAVNLIEQMSKAIRGEGDTSTSKKKTAISFLGSYINKGFNTYITENQARFPQAITITVDEWSGNTVDGQNANQLYAEYSAAMDQRCAEEVAAVTENKKSLIIAIAAVILGLICTAFTGPVGPIVGIVVGAIFGFKWFKSKKNVGVEQARIKENYVVKKQQGVNTIYACIVEWQDAQRTVVEFNNTPARSIIA